MNILDDCEYFFRYVYKTLTILNILDDCEHFFLLLVQNIDNCEHIIIMIVNISFVTEYYNNCEHFR